MVTKADFEALAEVRLADALYLLQAGRASSAYYLAGYAVELALKACIAKSFQPNAIPDKAFVNEIYSHSLEKLLGLAGLLPAFTTDSKANPSLARHGASQANGKKQADIYYGMASPPTVLLAQSEILTMESFNG